MKSDLFVRLLFYYLCSLVIAAILTPLVFHGALFWEAHWPSPTLAHWIGKGFGVFFERIRLGALLLFLPSLWYQYRQQPIFSPKSEKTSVTFFCYALIGAVLVLILCGWVVISNRPDNNILFQKLTPYFVVKSFLGALVVAVLEEWIFRGMIFQSLRMHCPQIIAIIFSSLIFAYLHFRPAPIVQQDIGLWSGFQYLYSYLFETVFSIRWAQFGLLFSFGFLLAAITSTTQTLKAAIGLHFGTVFTLMLLRQALIYNDHAAVFNVNTMISMPLAYVLIYVFSAYFLTKKAR
ncbi:MAG: CPBP family intramembrane metalloprotease [Verrucomicrobiota bacterium]|nr:MAG: CPBP family intramembrane metalloprotease [Verrucomicrobiota bacterium]